MKLSKKKKNCVAITHQHTTRSAIRYRMSIDYALSCFTTRRGVLVVKSLHDSLFCQSKVVNLTSVKFYYCLSDLTPFMSSVKWIESNDHT